MATKSSIAGFVFVSLAARVATGCLPQDTRPTPASLLVTASADPAIQQGFDTDDGWHIDFQRFLVSIGHASFSKSDSCNEYSDANYDRVLDLRQPGAQKINLIYGLGSCELDYRVAFPGSNVIAGNGVTDADVLFMRTQGSDRFTTRQGLTGRISGAARKSGEMKIFEWFFRQNWYYGNCRALTDDGGQTSLTLNGGEQDTVDVLVRGEELFRYSVLPEQPQVLLRFEPMAQADSQYGNKDGDVSLDELASVINAYPLDAAQYPPSGALIDAGPDDAGILGTSDLQALVYRQLFSKVFDYAGAGRCSVSDTRPDRR
jgi:hypothetical protein